MYTRAVAEFSERVLRLGGAPILVVGAPRSGTTWVQRLLLSDPRCCGGQESHFFATFGRVLRDCDHKASLPRPHGLACYWKRPELVDELRRLWLRTVAGVIDGSADAQVLVEKTPDHALWLDTAREIAPNARAVHVVRDSRAVCASLLAAGRSPWGSRWAPKSLDAAIEVWRRHVDSALSARVDATLVRYEDLHRDPHGTARALWRFAGLAIDDAALGPMLELQSVEAIRRGERPFEGTGDIRTTPAEPEGFVRGGSVDGWRRELGWFERRLVWRRTEDLMRRLGYDEAGARPAP